jgi:hypothetical protein
MEEIAPGLWHWTAPHPHIGSQVSSYYLAAERVLLDPMLPPDGPGWFSGQGAEPEHVLLTCRHHDRDSWRLQQEFGCEVHCVQSGCHELDGRGRVTPFSFGDELPGGVVARGVDAISPDETALHIPRHGALAVADGAVRWAGGQELSFVPDNLMDDPETTKQGLRRAYRGLLELDFDRLLLAHGDPITADGKEALRQFAGQD